jgi:hypothetical protein
MEMNTKHLLGSVGILCAAVVAGPAFAEAGIRDGADQFSNFNSTRTRADVQAEHANAKGEGTSVSMRDGEDKKTEGAYGVAGSRYSGLTREEVNTELTNSRKGPQRDYRDSIYFGS